MGRNPELNQDFLDLLEYLRKEEARFLVVGAHALAIHGVPRSTGDLHIWVRPDPTNAERVWRALAAFGAPLRALGLEIGDLAEKGTVFQLGVPPRRVDILTSISGVDFDAAWQGRVLQESEGRQLPFIGREDFLRNKRASGRAKDLADIALLEENETG